MNNQAFWENKKVFLTGHTGFKGGWLSLWLKSLKSEVTGYSLPPNTSPNLFNAANIEKNIHSIIGDIRDFETLKAKIHHTRPQIIFHLAAQSLVQASYHDPLNTYATNVMGTAHLLEAARQCDSVRVIIIITSDKCYENPEWVWGFRETDPIGGYDPYSSSKGCAELVTQAYQRSYFNAQDSEVGIASARAGNVIGGGDWAENRLIPDFIRAVSANKPIMLRNPLAIRPWQHVLEPLSGYLQLAEKLWYEPKKYSSAWNFAPIDDNVRSVQWITEYITQQWKGTYPWQLDKHAKPHEAQSLKLDSSKARFYLHWQPRWKIETALEMTLTWYKNFLAQTGIDSMQDICLQQIYEYNNIVET